MNMTKTVDARGCSCSHIIFHMFTGPSQRVPLLFIYYQRKTYPQVLTRCCTIHRCPQEDEIVGLFRTLEHRGFCSSSSSNSSSGSQLQPTRDGQGGEMEDRHRGETDGEPKIDAILHSVAHAPTEAMKGVSFLQVKGRVLLGNNVRFL